MGASSKLLKAFLSTTRLSRKPLFFEVEEKECTKARKGRLWRSPATPRRGLQDEVEEGDEGEHAREEAEDQVGSDEKESADAMGVASLQNLESEKRAALRIQAAFRGFLSRRALKALKSLVRLQALVRGRQVRKQTAMALRCMHVLVRVQARVRAHSAYMPEESAPVQHKVNEHRVLLLEAQSPSPHLPAPGQKGWCDSHCTVEELEAKLQQKQFGAIKRVREMVYARSHQCRCQDVRSYTVASNQPHREWGPGEAAKPLRRPLNEDQPDESELQYQRSWDITQSAVRSNTGPRMVPPIHKLNLEERGSPLSSTSKGTTPTSYSRDQASLPSYMAATLSATAKCRTVSP